jgi:ABC-type uncharacterized transport system YnjBCD substrate-binding protein
LAWQASAKAAALAAQNRLLSAESQAQAQEESEEAIDRAVQGEDDSN